MKSIRRSVFLAQTAMALVVSVVLGLASYSLMAKHVVATARDMLLLITAEEAIELSQRINDHREFFREVAREELMEFSSPRFDAVGFVDHFAHFTDRYDSLSFIGFDGREQVRLDGGRQVDSLRDFSGDLLFREALTNPEHTVAADVDREPGGRVPFLRFAYALDVGGGGNVGVMVGELPLERIASVMLGGALGHSGTTALISNDGTILWHGRKELLMGSLAVVGGEGFLRDVGEGRRGFRSTEIFGSEGYAAYSPVPGFPWAVLAILPRKEVMAGAVTMGNSVFGISLLVMLLGGTAATVLTRRIAEPLEELAVAVQDVTGGNMARRVAVRGDDEVARLARSFNAMTEKLEKSCAELQGDTPEPRMTEPLE